MLKTLFRSANHFPPWILCVPGPKEMVGAVLQAAMARYYCYLSEGTVGWSTWKREGNGEGHQEDGHSLLSSGIHSLRQEVVLKA